MPNQTSIAGPLLVAPLMAAVFAADVNGAEEMTSARTTSRTSDMSSAGPAPLAVPTTEVLSDSPRLFRAGPSPRYFAGQHEPPPNYNFRDPRYYPDSGLGFPILSAHGTWIGGRSGVRGWKHRGYHENYRQATFQWRW